MTRVHTHKFRCHHSLTMYCSESGHHALVATHVCCGAGIISIYQPGLIGPLLSNKYFSHQDTKAPSRDREPGINFLGGFVALCERKIFATEGTAGTEDFGNIFCHECTRMGTNGIDSYFTLRRAGLSAAKIRPCSPPRGGYNRYLSTGLRPCLAKQP
jgi:hypothetical protein